MKWEKEEQTHRKKTQRKGGKKGGKGREKEELNLNTAKSDWEVKFLQQQWAHVYIHAYMHMYTCAHTRALPRQEHTRKLL